MSEGKPYYPTNPSEWSDWMQNKMSITASHGTELLTSGSFPIDQLIECWNEEFTTEKGYSPDFIPALIRNANSLLKLVFGENPEPDWRGADA